MNACIIKSYKILNYEKYSFDSMIYGVQYYTKPYPSVEGISINCYDMSEKSGIQRVLRVAVNTEEYSYFLINEAYN